MTFGEDLSIILKELCLQLKKSKLRFCLAGGWAVSMMGIARTTLDIDLLVVLNENSKKKIVSILKNSFKLIQSHDDEMEFKTTNIWRNIISLKEKEEPFMIDLIKADSDYLTSVIDRCMEIDFEGVLIPVISVEDLIVLKMFSFRKQDQLDIENLLSSGTPIDMKYLEEKIRFFHLNWDYIVVR